MAKTTDELLLALQQLEQAPAAVIDSQAIRALLLALLREVIALRAETDVLRAALASNEQRSVQTSPWQNQRTHTWPVNELPVQPPMQRPLDYWAANVPDYGDNLTEEDIQRHLAKPRQLADPPPPTAPQQVPSEQLPRSSGLSQPERPRSVLFWGLLALVLLLTIFVLLWPILL